MGEVGKKDEGKITRRKKVADEIMEAATRSRKERTLSSSVEFEREAREYVFFSFTHSKGLTRVTYTIKIRVTLSSNVMNTRNQARRFVIL